MSLTATAGSWVCCPRTEGKKFFSSLRYQAFFTLSISCILGRYEHKTYCHFPLRQLFAPKLKQLYSSCYVRQYEILHVDSFVSMELSV